MSEFGSKLRELREKNGRTQQEIADHFYVSAATVSRWESGTRYPDLFTAKKLADYYGTSLDEILGEKAVDEYAWRQTARDGRIQIALYTVCAIVFVIRVMGFFLFPQVHDGSTGAVIAEAVQWISAGMILIMLVIGLITSMKTGPDSLMGGWIAIVFFAAQLIIALGSYRDIGTVLVYALPPCVCLALTYRFFFRMKTDAARYLQGMLVIYLFIHVIACFLESQTYAYTSTSFVTRYRFLWSFVNPLCTVCLMILLIWQVYSIHCKVKKEEGGTK